MARFKKGTSGNLAGRPKGSKSAPNLLRDGLVNLDELKKVIAVIVGKAKEGDLQAAALLLDRCVPKLRQASDVTDEAELAEATAAAKVRGAIGEATRGMTLEDLLEASREPALEILIEGTAERSTIDLNLEAALQRQRRATIERGFSHE